MGHFSPIFGKEANIFMGPIACNKNHNHITMAINTQIATLSPPTFTSSKSCKKWGAPWPFCIQPVPTTFTFGVQMAGIRLGLRKRKREREEKEGRTAEERRGRETETEGCRTSAK